MQQDAPQGAMATTEGINLGVLLASAAGVGPTIFAKWRLANSL